MMIVAVPLSACLAMACVGAYSSLVEYSVHQPISQPASSPTPTDMNNMLLSGSSKLARK